MSWRGRALAAALALFAGWRPPAAPCAGVDDPAPLTLDLNLPAFRLVALVGGVPVTTLRVAVGQVKYPTPIGRYTVDYLIWNPWWYPPPSWWARKEHITPPGWANPVGRVKLHVTGSVFVHGSPLENSIGTASSHACVRLPNRDAIALARLVHRHGTPSLPVAVLDSLERDTASTRRIALTVPVPITIRYDLVETLGDDLVVHPDLYYLAGNRVPTTARSAQRALAALGRDTTRFRAAAFRRLARRALRADAIIPFDSVLAGPIAR